jgi:uncharacterized oligopeptide transporter (OPT) family protein
MLKIFNNMTLVDWLLGAAFTALVAYLVNSLFPPYGWGIGILVSLLLLYLAKKRRDNLQTPPDNK